MAPKRLRAVRKPIAVPREVTATNVAPVPVEPVLMDAPVPFVWTTERTLALLNCMIGRKPAGINKHLNVLLIKTHLSKRLNMNVPIREIWRFINAHWDIALADRIEYQCTKIEKKDFDLPQTEDWQQLIREESEKCKKMEYEEGIKMQESQAATSSDKDLIILKDVRVMVERMDG